MKRIAALDMLRGYALVCIMMDHMPVAALRDYTLANYQLFDAAELFVLLSGFLVGLVWIRIEARDGRGAARRRFLRRSFTVWRALLIGAVLMALLSAVLLAFGFNHTAIWNAYAEMILTRPIWYLMAVGSLWMNPNLLDVLALYVILIALTPFLMPLLLRWPVRFFAVSILIWLLAREINPLIPNHRAGLGFVFNPFGWQLLFFAGAAMGVWREPLMARLLPWRRWLTPAAIAIALFGLAAVVAEDYLPLEGAFRSALRFVHGPIDKWSLDGWRFLSILAAAWLVAVPWATVFERMAATRPGLALAEIGRGGLLSFVACVLLSVVGDALHMKMPYFASGVLIDIALILTLWVIASWWLQRGRLKASPRVAATAGS
ncbi:MAG: hypothetical protein CSB44_00065 [Gammaproteobacteria bacterium]|nr:MAG: hypothetical protein CSB44_00065 [Gammaproteobacteria bacterium]